MPLNQSMLGSQMVLHGWRRSSSSIVNGALSRKSMLQSLPDYVENTMSASPKSRVA
ncbi:hypothetical protein EMPG_11495 [Blastomyces silverae]|uniref:Uncharacterized protein n=1 Tax=Blastomyces silverae TaxID=2060906 RepID=A0A0H1BPU3_9EURO|nr:hypothetical protein EMPG_11495 [Blastomyces silverae]